MSYIKDTTLPNTITNKKDNIKMLLLDYILTNIVCAITRNLACVIFDTIYVSFQTRVLLEQKLFVYNTRI